MFSKLLTCTRVRQSKPVKDEIHVTYLDGLPGLPVLTISAGWQPRNQNWKDHDVYRVEEIPSSGGRAFLLHRSEQAIAADGPDGDTYYGVEVESPESFRCECRGFAARSRCKHCDAVLHLLAGGHLAHPMADAPIPSDDPFLGVVLS